MLVRREVLPLFDELVVRVEAVAGQGFMTSSGGYNFRPKRRMEKLYAQTKNSDYLSNHSWATAGDFRAGTNPGYENKHTDFPRNTGDIAASVGLSWAGLWKQPYDPMHFEFLGSPTDASEWVARLHIQKLSNAIKDDLDMTPEQFEEVTTKLDAILYQLGYDVNSQKWGTFEVWDGTHRKLTLVDMLRETHRELNQRLTRGVNTDTLLGHVLNIARSLKL